MLEFLDNEDNAIWKRLVIDKGLDPPLSFIRFWRSGKIQLDGDFSLEEIQAFAEAMSQMAERRRALTNEVPHQATHQHIQDLLSREPVILRSWCDKAGYFVGDISVDDCSFIDASGASTMESLLVDINKQARAYLEEQS